MLSPEVAGLPGSIRLGTLSGAEQRRTVHQNQMTADGKLWVRSRELNGIVERRRSWPSGWWRSRCRQLCASTIPRFTPAVRPKSSALTIKRRTRHCSSSWHLAISIWRRAIQRRNSPCAKAKSQELVRRWPLSSGSRILQTVPEKRFSSFRGSHGAQIGSEGRLAQLVRAPALQAGGRRFESCTAHQFGNFGRKPGT